MLIDHDTEETMPLFAGTEYSVGLTVYPVTNSRRSGQGTWPGSTIWTG